MFIHTCICVHASVVKVSLFQFHHALFCFCRGSNKISVFIIISNLVIDYYDPYNYFNLCI